VRDGDDAVMVEVETDQYVSQRNLGANGKPIRRGRPGQFAKTPDEVAEPAVAVQRGGVSASSRSPSGQGRHRRQTELALVD
jgi:hypothetical protein